MRGTLAYISLLLLNASLISMAPATPGASTDSGTSLIQLNDMTPAFPNATSSLSSTFCPTSNTLNSGDVETHRFAVPGTTTVLIIFYCPGLPINRNIIRQTINTAGTHMESQLNMYGDRPLLAVDDPYFTPVVEDVNCTMRINSQRVPHTEIIPNHLTYQITVNALQGLYDFLYRDNHAASAVTEVLDPGLTGSMVRVGLISISPMEG